MQLLGLSSSSSIRVTDTAAVLIALWVAKKIVERLRRRLRTTKLRGPSRDSFVFGALKALEDSPDAGAMHEAWVDAYGSAYIMPAPLGSSRVVINDPKAIAKFFSLDNTAFDKTPAMRAGFLSIVGKSILWAFGEDHTRQRRALAPSFTITAIKSILPVFLDSAYKAKAAWDTRIELSPNRESVIDVSEWMNYISLDSIGIAGFSHDFQALAGKKSPLSVILEELNNFRPSGLGKALFLLTAIFPSLHSAPTTRQTLIKRMKAESGKLAQQLLEKAKMEKEDLKQDRSIIGALIRSEGSRLTEEEIIAQMNTLILAGYETTAISMTWALIELALNPHVQDKLREELSQLPASDPTYEELTNSLPYLDAFCQEVLRLHSSIPENIRMAVKDEVLPLSTPLESKDGQLVDHISIARGTIVNVSLRSINRSNALWGEDAKVFRPERWIEGIGEKAEQIHGQKHILTFIDGPRACIGKTFALTEFKAVISVLARNFAFELPNGKDTKIETKRTLVYRPRVAGEEGSRVPMRVRRLEGLA